jgi:glutamate synthase (NADPH) large chain
MSGGIAYVYDPDAVFANRVNYEMVTLDDLDDDDHAFLRGAVERHLEFTGSAVAQRLLLDWDTSLRHFRKVMPMDYQRVLAVMKAAAAEGLDESATVDRVMEAARG